MESGCDDQWTRGLMRIRRSDTMFVLKAVLLKCKVLHWCCHIQELCK
jgi:hypothetical protein